MVQVVRRVREAGNEIIVVDVQRPAVEASSAERTEIKNLTVNPACGAPGLLAAGKIRLARDDTRGVDAVGFTVSASQPAKVGSRVGDPACGVLIANWNAGVIGSLGINPAHHRAADDHAGGVDRVAMTVVTTGG